MITISFYSTNYTLMAEKVLKENGINTMIIPTPREITENCGMSLKIDEESIENARKIMEENSVEYMGIHEIIDKKAILIEK